MNIMIVGVCDVESSTNTFMATAFRTLGHNVICYNYRTRLRLYSGNQGRLEEDLISTLKAIQGNGGVDLLIFCKVDSLPIPAMRKATELVNTFYWFMDPITTAKAIQADMRASACNNASATCLEVVNFFTENGQPNSYKINEGVDLALFKNLNMKKKYDVLFVGSPTQERHQFIDFLIHSGIHVKVFGEGWHDKYGETHPIYSAGLVAEINQARIVLNVSRTDSYSDRVTQSMAAGAFVMTSLTNEIYSDFLVGTHLDVFSTPENLYKKIRAYLDNKTHREQVAKEGCAMIRSRASWEQVCESLLGKVKNNELF